MVDGADGGTGAPGASGGAGGGNGGATGAGASGAGTGGEGAAGEKGLDRSKLNPIIKGMSEEQINGLLDEMVLAVSTRKPADGGAQTPPKPVVPTGPTEAEIREMFDPASDKFDPAAAVRKIAEANYGPVIADIGRNAAEAVFTQFRSEYPDFKDYEQDIRKVLKDSGVAAPTPQQINTVFMATKGHRITMKEKESRATARTAAPSAPKEPAEPKVIELDEQEKRVARRMFSGSADPEKDYRDYVARLDAGDTTMKVPLSGGQKR